MGRGEREKRRTEEKDKKWERWRENEKENAPKLKCSSLLVSYGLRQSYILLSAQPKPLRKIIQELGP